MNESYAREIRMLEARAVLEYGQAREAAAVINTLKRVKAIRTSEDGEIEARRNGKWSVSPTLSRAHDDDPVTLQQAAQDAGVAIYYR